MRDRRSTRALIAQYAKRQKFALPLVTFLLDWLGWGFGIFLVVADTSLAVKLVGSLLLWVTTLRLMIIGHEACHGAYVPNSRLNKIIGRLAFLPSSIPFSLWELGHNVAHHGYTNYRHFDFVWTPLTVEEYSKLSKSRKLLERFYRSGFGPGVYHILEIWNKRLFFPRKTFLMRQNSKMFLVDNIAITLFAFSWMGGLIYSGYATNQSSSVAVILGFIIPWLMFAHSFGISVYLQHTHPDVRWYDDKRRWSEELGYITTSTHLEMKGFLGALMYNVMSHTAHHVDMSIGFEQLPPAQRVLEAAFPQNIVVQKFSWKWYMATARHCQLYDYQNQKWRPFSVSAAASQSSLDGSKQLLESATPVVGLDCVVSAEPRG